MKYLKGRHWFIKPIAPEVNSILGHFLNEKFGTTEPAVIDTEDGRVVAFPIEDEDEMPTILGKREIQQEGGMKIYCEFPGESIKQEVNLLSAIMSFKGIIFFREHAGKLGEEARKAYATIVVREIRPVIQDFLNENKKEIAIMAVKNSYTENFKGEVTTSYLRGVDRETYFALKRNFSEIEFFVRKNQIRARKR